LLNYFCKDKYFIAERSIHLINGILDIAIAHRWLQTSLRCMELSQLLVQAMWFQDSSLVQLPYINQDILKTMKLKKKNIRNIIQLREMNDDERK
jgi:translocation protein SEC63